MDRERISSGTPWEPIVGIPEPYGSIASSTCRATATNPAGEVVGVGDPYAQAVQCLENIQDALSRLGARLEDVVRTRVYVTDIVQWEAIGRAHGEFFGSIRPASTMVEVRALVAPEMLVEIEVEAVIGI